MPVMSRVDSDWREGRLARPESIAHGPVHVEPVRGEDDARRVARRIALADDQDRVGRVLGREAVRGAERGGIGERRIAGEQLVVDAERLERGDEPVASGRVVAGEIDVWGGLGHGRKGTRRGAADRYHRPMTDRTDAPDATSPDGPGPRIDWHPEPELIAYGDEATSRAAMTRLGERTWGAALDYVYGIAVQRAMGDPSGYQELRRDYFAPSGGGPASAPRGRCARTTSWPSSRPASRAG